MGDVSDKTFTKTTSSVSIAAGSEGTLLSVTAGGILAFRGGQTVVTGWTEIAPSTGAVGMTMTLYRGTSTAGTQIATGSSGYNIVTTTGAMNLTITGTEQLTNVDAVSYTMTAQPAGTAATAVARQSSLEIEIIN